MNNLRRPTTTTMSLGRPGWRGIRGFAAPEVQVAVPEVAKPSEGSVGREPKALYGLGPARKPPTSAAHCLNRASAPGAWRPNFVQLFSGGPRSAGPRRNWDGHEGYAAEIHGPGGVTNRPARSAAPDQRPAETGACSTTPSSLFTNPSFGPDAVSHNRPRMSSAKGRGPQPETAFLRLDGRKPA